MNKFLLVLAIFFTQPVLGKWARMSTHFKVEEQAHALTVLSNVVNDGTPSHPYLWQLIETLQSFRLTVSIEGNDYTLEDFPLDWEETPEQLAIAQRGIAIATWANTFQNLHCHDEILIVHRPVDSSVFDPRYPWMQGIGQILAIVAIDRRGINDARLRFGLSPFAFFHSHENLVAESGLGLTLPNQIGELKNRLTSSPSHWHPRFFRSDLHFKKVVGHDAILFNVLMADKKALGGAHSQRLTNALGPLAYELGLLSTGRILDPKQAAVVDGKRFEGPLIFEPSIVYAEGVGARLRLHQRRLPNPVSLDGKTSWVGKRTVTPVGLLHLSGETAREKYSTHPTLLTNARYAEDFHPVSGRLVRQKINVPCWREITQSTD